MCNVDSYSRFTSNLTHERRPMIQCVKHHEVWPMCHDMRRYEKMAEEKRRRENEQTIDFLIKDEPEKIPVASETKVKKHETKISS